MQFQFNKQHSSDRSSFAAFVDEHLVPFADEWDRQQALPDSLIRKLGQARYLVATLPQDLGGLGMDMVTYGLLAEEIGRGCGSARNLIAVQGMVAHSILKWGTPEQVSRWVPQIGNGGLVAAFALTEPDNGSDARNGVMTAREDVADFVLDGQKTWISFGARAGLFLVFARLADGHLGAFMVERDRPGLSLRPILGLLGLRASSLAEVTFDGCRIPQENVVCRGPLTFDAVATSALDYGRYSTACGCVGLSQACLDASLAYAGQRKQFGVPIEQHQLIGRMLTDIICQVSAARALCREAGSLRDEGTPESIRQTLIAKYVASTSAYRVASDTVQIHGANGCSDEYPVQRYLRDAKIQEIIEGTNQILQLQIAKLTLRAKSRSNLAIPVKFLST